VLVQGIEQSAFANSLDKLVVKPANDYSAGHTGMLFV
jgi:hypothetical protein